MGILIDLIHTPISSIIFLSTSIISLLALYKYPLIFEKFIFNPYSFKRGERPLSILTSSLIHGDLFHLIFNMMSFYFFAFNLELIVGHLNFLIIYFLSVIFSSVPSIIKHSNNMDYYSLGASGGISGILFAFILFEPDSSIMMLYIPIPIPSYIFGVLYLLWSWYADKNANDNIGHDAHLWGALSGLIVTIFLYYEHGIISNFISKLTN